MEVELMNDILLFKRSWMIAIT